MADSAKTTFDIAIGRAKWLNRMAVGLTDHRSRAVRDDWALKLKKIMHWPQSHQIGRIDSKDVMIVTRNDATIGRSDFQSEQMDDMLRAAIVLAISAMDAYYHAKICRYIVHHANRAEGNDELLKRKIKVSDFLKAAKLKRRNNALAEAISRDIGFESFQQPGKIESGLKLIGVSDFWPAIGRDLRTPVDDIKQQLSGIVKRRNQIAHEGDVMQSKKYRNKPRGITNKYVSESLTFLDNLVAASEKVIDAQI